MEYIIKVLIAMYRTNIIKVPKINIEFIGSVESR